MEARETIKRTVYMNQRMVGFPALFCILIHIPMLLSCQESIRRKTDIPRAQLDSIAAYIETLPDNTQLSLALINDSVTSFLGFIKTDSEWSVVENRDSVFEIGSISKVFTSTLLVQMADQGLVDLDDPIAGITPYKMNRSGLKGKEITLNPFKPYIGTAQSSW